MTVAWTQCFLIAFKGMPKNWVLRKFWTIPHNQNVRKYFKFDNSVTVYPEAGL